MAQEINLDSVIVQSSDLINTPMEEGQIILSIENGKYYGVTAVGERIWQLIATPMSLSAVCDTLLNEYDIDRPTCEQQVLKFVERMVADGIVQVRTTD